MVQRRSRRAQRKPPEVVPPKSDEDANAEAGDANPDESDEEDDAKSNTTAASSRPRRRRGRKPKEAEASENEDNSSDEGKSQENTDTGGSSDDDEPISALAKKTRPQKKPAETDDAGKKTPKRRGRAKKKVETESNDEDESEPEKETIRKSKRRNAGRRKQKDPSSASEDESSKKVTRRRGRQKKSQGTEESDSKVDSAEDESASEEEQEEEESTKQPRRRRGRARKNQEAEDNDSKVESAQENAEESEEEEEEEESTKQRKRRRGRPRKNRDAEDNDSKTETAEEDVEESEEESTKTPTRRRGRPRKNQDPEEINSKAKSAEGDGASSEEEEESESTKKSTRRRGRPRKNQDGKDHDSKMETTEEEGGESEEESTKKPTRRRTRPRKKQDADDSDSKMENAEEDGGSSEDKTAEDSRNNETITRAARRLGKPKRSSEASSNEDGDQETQPKDAEEKNATAQTHGPLSNDKQGNDEEAPRKRGRSGRPRSASADEKESAEANESSSRKRGRTPPLSTSDDPSAATQPTRVSKRRLEKIEEATPAEADSAASSGEKKAQEELTETSTDKSTKEEVPSAEGAANDKNEDEAQPQEEKQEKTSKGAATRDKTEDEGSSSEAVPQQEKKIAEIATKDKKEDEGPLSNPEPQQVKRQKTNTKAITEDKTEDEGSSEQEAEPKHEKEENPNGNTSGTSIPTSRPKRQRGPLEQPAATAGPKPTDDTEMKDKDDEPETQDKKRARVGLIEARKEAIDRAGETVEKPAEPISTKTDAMSPSKTVEEKDSENEKTDSCAALQEPKGANPGTTARVAQKKYPSEETAKIKVPDTSKENTDSPAEKKTEHFVLPATSNSKDEAKDMGEDKKTELPTKVAHSVNKPSPSTVELLVTTPTARPSSESHEAVSHSNVPAEKKKEEASEQASNQDSVELNQIKPMTENDAPTVSLEPSKKGETTEVIKVQSSPPPPTNDHVEPRGPSLTSSDKDPKADFSDAITTSSKEAKKVEQSDNQDGNRASDMDVDSPKENVGTVDVEKSTPPPQEAPGMVVAPGETSIVKESQPKLSEITQAAPQTKPVQITTPIVSEQGKSSSTRGTEPPTIASATKSMSSEIAVIPTGTSPPHKDSNVGAIDSNEAVGSDDFSECAESSPVTESSSEDDDESSGEEDEEDQPEPRFETKVLPFNSSNRSPKKQQTSLEVLGNKVDRAKTLLYTIGSRVHRGRGFERIFAKYWEALTMRLSDRLSSYASRQCNAAIKTFLKSPKLRRIHNKLVITLMKASVKSFAPLSEISEHIPKMWYDKVKQVDRVRVEDGLKETKGQRKTREKKAARQQAAVYSEAWESTQVTEEKPLSEVCLKTQCQEVDMRKIHASSASVPGALVIDPLVREIAEENSMRASENAIWLLIIAAREHTSNVLKNALQYKTDMESGEVSEPILQYPNVLAGTKTAPKRDGLAETTEQQPSPAPVEYRPGKSQTRKVVTSFDIYASSLAIPTGPPASLGGSVSTAALELCLQNAYTSSSSGPGADFSDVQKHIVERITALALDRKAMLIAKSEEAKSNQVNLVNSQQQVATKTQNLVKNASVVGNAHSRTSAVNMNALAGGQARPNVPAATPALAVQMQQEKVKTVPNSAPTNAAAALLNPPGAAIETKPLAAGPGRLGRGAKDLATLLKRSPADPASAPVNDDKGAVATESTALSANSSPQKPGEKSEVDELGSSTGSRKRGLGFGAKNLAALKARTSKPGEEKAAPSESVPTTIATNEPQKQEQRAEPNTGRRPIGAKNIAALKGPAGSKDLAALRARSAAKAGDEAGKNSDGTEQKTEPKSDPRAPESLSQADAPVGASPTATEAEADPSKPLGLVNEIKADSSNAQSPGDNKKMDGTTSGEKDGGESDDSSVIVIEKVNPAPKTGTQGSSSSEDKGTVATTRQSNGQKVEVKDANATSDTQPTPAAVPKKLVESSSATDKAPQESTVEKKEAEISKEAPVTAEEKDTLEVKRDKGGQSTPSPPTAASTDEAKPKEGEGSEGMKEAAKNAEGDATSAVKAEESKEKEDSTAKPEGAETDEKAAAKPQETKVDASSAPEKSDETAEPSK